jgi:hypothetical protein
LRFDGGETSPMRPPSKRVVEIACASAGLGAISSMRRLGDDRCGRHAE